MLSKCGAAVGNGNWRRKQGKELQGLVSHGREFGFYAKNFGDHLRVLRNLQNGSKEGAELDAAIAVRSSGGQNSEGSAIERGEQSREKLRDIINEMW